MGTKLEAATQGRIKLQMFRGSVLGGEKEVIWQTQVGAIQILRTSLGPSGGPGGAGGPLVPEVNVFGMPLVLLMVTYSSALSLWLPRLMGM